MRKQVMTLVTFFFFSVVIFVLGLMQWSEKENQVTSSLSNNEQQYVTPEEFGANGQDKKDDSKAIQEAIDYSVKENIGTVYLSGNKRYILTSGIVIREKVEVKMDQNTKIYVEGDFRVFDLKRNASITNGMIEVTTPTFHSEVVYLDGSEKYWSTERTRVHNVTVFNSSGSHRGTGIALSAEKPGDYISFVNVSDVTIVGFHQGILLKATQRIKDDQYTWVNGNRFTNITLDDCVRCIELIGNVTVPNETSGNQFNQLQIQVSTITEKALVVSGSSNQFDGMVWDAHLAGNDTALVDLTSQSADNEVHLNLVKKQVSNDGTRNEYSGKP
jgi:hypothetical protein